MVSFYDMLRNKEHRFDDGLDYYNFAENYSLLLLAHPTNLELNNLLRAQLESAIRISHKIFLS